MYRPADYDPVAPIFVSPWSWNSVGPKYRGVSVTAPASGTWASGSRQFFVPFFLHQPYDLQRFWWLNGATVGTDSLQAGIYAEDWVLAVASARTLSAGTVNQNQYATCAVTGAPATFGNQTTSSTSYSPGSPTFYARPGLMYTVSVMNTHGTSANTVTVSMGSYTFTSRATTQFNGTAARISVFTCVPDVDSTATLTVTASGGQTATGWAVSVDAFTNVDTATNDGFVQTATGTGNSGTALATLGAFASSNNATFGAHANAGGSSAAPGTGFVELIDTASAPVGIEVEYASANDTTVDATITSSQWGSVAAEIKSLGTTRALAPGRYYMALTCTGTTATVFRASSAPQVSHLGVYAGSATYGLPIVAGPGASTNSVLPVFGITNRATP